MFSRVFCKKHPITNIQEAIYVFNIPNLRKITATPQEAESEESATDKEAISTRRRWRSTELFKRAIGTWTMKKWAKKIDLWWIYIWLNHH